jgi:hypothetical protein
VFPARLAVIIEMRFEARGEAGWAMGNQLDACPRCNGSRIEIDRFGDRLLGCIECNRWTWPGNDSITMALPEEDLWTLKAFVTRR